MPGAAASRTPTVRQSRGPRAFRPVWARPFARAPRFVQDAAAVTPVVGTILVLAISTIGIAVVMNWGLPAVQQTKAESERLGVLDQFHVFDAVGESVMRGGAKGKASEANLNIPVGEMHRVKGPLLAISWFPNMTGGNVNRFHVAGLGDDDPSTFSILAAAGNDPLVSARWEVDQIEDVDVRSGESGGFDANGVGNVIIDHTGHDILEYPHRLRVIDDADEDIIYMETWILPLGSLLYQRFTPYGNIGIRLENGAVISEMETGNFITSEPLVTRETDPVDGRFDFIGLFVMLYGENQTHPGVELGGAGSYPILFSLRHNNLRVPGDEAVALYLNFTGDRSVLWQQYYVENYGFAIADAVYNEGDGIEYEAPNVGAGPEQYGFDIVVLESQLEVQLKLDRFDLGDGA